MKLTWIILFSLVGLISCQTPPPIIEKPSAHSTWKDPQTQALIDLDELQDRLGLSRDMTELGFVEKLFNTCQVGSGFSATENCINQYMTVIHFRIQCRDTEGTVNYVSEQALRPVVSDSVTWKLPRLKGQTFTNENGFGQVRYLSPRSSSHQKIRLTMFGKFLVITAGELKRVVVEKNWCGPKA